MILCHLDVNFFNSTAQDKMKDDRPIVYIDKTWVNQNHSRSMICQNEYGIERLKVPTGKGCRFIVCHYTQLDVLVTALFKGPN